MKRILIAQSLFWAAAIIVSTLLAPSQSGWLVLTVLATVSLGALKNGLDSFRNDAD